MKTKRILKFPFAEGPLDLPVGAIIRYIGTIGEELFIWVEVEEVKDTVHQMETRYFEFYGTRHEIEIPQGDEMIYLTTRFLGPLAAFIYERRKSL